MNHPTLPQSGSTGVELSLRAIASVAWRSRLDPAVNRLAHELTGGREGDPTMTVPEQVAAVMNHILRHIGFDCTDPTEREFLHRFEPDRPTPILDADDAVLVAATLLLCAWPNGIDLSIVGARFGHSWTCWLAYRDDGRWIMVDVLDGGRQPTRQPDERIDIAVDGS